jgi:hypothetical protein
MKKILLAAALVVVGTVPCAQGKQDGCFSPLEWEGEGKAGFRACNKTAGCEICAAESGAAFGFCAAYCEAMDCDDDEPAASEAACLKVKDKYIQVTGNPKLPCEGDRLERVSCGSFSSCIYCLEGEEDTCTDCADDLSSLGGCTNICSP